MKIITTLILVLVYQVCLAQDSTSLLLHSWKKQKRVAEIPYDAEITVRLDYSDSLKANKLSPESFSGSLRCIYNHVLYMTVDEERSTLLKPDGTKKEILVYYTLYDSLEGVNDGEMKKIAIERIKSISYSNQRGVSVLGYAIAGLSAFTALVVAPLVSVNFKNGDFRQNRYYSVLGGCAIGFSVSLPIGIIFNKYKTYHIKNYTPNTDDMNYYSIGDRQ